MLQVLRFGFHGFSSATFAAVCGGVRFTFSGAKQGEIKAPQSARRTTRRTDKRAERWQKKETLRPFDGWGRRKVFAIVICQFITISFLPISIPSSPQVEKYSGRKEWKEGISSCEGFRVGKGKRFYGRSTLVSSFWLLMCCLRGRRGFTTHSWFINSLIIHRRSY